ncbi:hypothetical protein Trydic_g8349 [Trypoxylus dichotomus]
MKTKSARLDMMSSNMEWGKHRLPARFRTTSKGKVHAALVRGEFVITAQDRASGSLDLKPLDYCLWNALEEKTSSKLHRNIEPLKADLVKAAASIPRACGDRGVVASFEAVYGSKRRTF